MKQLFFLLWITVTLNALGTEPLLLIDQKKPKLGWNAFGQGIYNLSAYPGESSFSVALDWKRNTWGNGAYYKADAAINVAPFKKIVFDVSSQLPTKICLQVQFLTADGAILETSKNKVISISAGKESHFEAVIASMNTQPPTIKQRAFLHSDLNSVDKIQIVFSRPPSREKSNVLKFRNINLLP